MAKGMGGAHIPSEENWVDMLTKPLPGRAKQDSLVSQVLHDIVNKGDSLDP